MRYNIGNTSVYDYLAAEKLKGVDWKKVSQVDMTFRSGGEQKKTWKKTMDASDNVEEAVMVQRYLGRNLTHPEKLLANPPCLGDTVSRCIPIMLGKEAPTFMPIDAFDCDHSEGAVTVVVTDRTDVLQKGANKQHVIRVPLVRDSKGPEYQAISTFLQSDLLVDVPGRVVEFCLARTTEVFVLCEDETGHRSIYEIPRKEETAYSAPSA